MPVLYRFLLTIPVCLYLLSPYDLMPGFLDDLVLLVIFIYYQLKWAKRRPASDGTGAETGGDRGPRRRDPYMVLEVEKNAGPDEIRKAYRRLAQAYHPDKVAHLGPELRELAGRKFIEIQEAYRQLMT